MIQQVAQQVKTQASNARVLHNVEKENGDLLANVCDIPRNNRQERYARKKESALTHDPLLELMNMQNNDDSFIRRIFIDTNSPAVILFNDEQLLNVTRRKRTRGRKTGFGLKLLHGV